MTRYLFDARAHTAHFPGIGRTIEGLLPALIEACHPDEEVVALAVGGDSWPCEQIVSTVSPLALRQHVTVPSVIARVAPSVYHSPYVTVPLRPGAPTVVTVNDVIPLQERGHLPPARRPMYRAALHQALWTARQVLAPSQATAETLRRLWPRRPVVVVAHGVDTALFRPRPPTEIAAVRTRFGLDAPYALTVASDRPHKNLAALIEAWRLVGPTGTELVIVGDVHRSVPPMVRTVACVDDDVLAALYSGAEVAITASRHEGFGLPVLEAMACGTAVACSAIPVLSEMAGESGTYFDPRDPDAMADGLRRLLGDDVERARRAAAGRTRAATFSWADAAERTLAVYRQAV